MIHQAIVAITEHLPKGTNKRIHDALFAIMSGRLLETRGAIMPALTLMNLDPNAVLRTREAMAEGAWTIRGLLKRFWNWLESQGQWKPLEVRGYRVNALDTTCIYRPRLKNCQTKHYQSTAGKALPQDLRSSLNRAKILRHNKPCQESSPEMSIANFFFQAKSTTP
jgi:hypothetical protein